MSVVSFPPCQGPRDLPEVRAWLAHLYRPTSRFVEYATDTKFIRETLKTARLWWVTKETCEMLAGSSHTIPDDVILDWKDIPVPAGFAVFEEDLMGIDSEIADNEVRISAIMWGPVMLPPVGAAKIGPNLFENTGEPGRVGLGIGMWTRANLENGLTGEMLQKHMGTIAALTDEMPLLQLNTSHVMRGDVFTYMGRTDWLDGRPVTELTPGATRTSTTAAQSMTEDRKLITALWAITRTPIVSLVHEPIPRFISRRSTRKGYNADVQVLTLHGPRLDQPTEHVEGAARDWQHQWIVSPHWRWQPYGPGRKLRRLTLIPAYRKGPSDKPLLGGERVWRVVPPQGAPSP
jgi:hypothetical protein